MADDDVARDEETRPPTPAKKAAKKATKRASGAKKRASKSAAKVPDAPRPTATKSELPYVLTTARMPDLFAKIQAAAVPPRVTYQFLRHLGFTSSNDRAFNSLLRKLGFTDGNGVPTDRYREYKNPDDAPRALAEGIRELYADLFAVNEQIHDRDVSTVRGVVSRVTGIDTRRAGLIARTFRALADLGDFEPVGTPAAQPTPEPTAQGQAATWPPIATDHARTKRIEAGLPAFRYNIEIHLPATTDLAVYNAIFRSLREHLAD